MTGIIVVEKSQPATEAWEENGLATGKFREDFKGRCSCETSQSPW